MRKVMIGNSHLEPVPTTVGDYELVKQIGRGTFSTIFRALHKKTEKTVAIKVVSRQFLIEKHAVESFQREVTVFSQLDHPNIIKFIEMLSDENLIYIVMEYCAKGSLQDLVSLNGGIGERDSKPLVHQICDAVAYLHDLGIAHRDLKLENILVHENETVKLADFGLCREIVGKELMKTQCGSPLYAPPEIVENKHYEGRKSDMWSIGVCIFTLVTGALPWRDCNNLTNLFYDIQTSRYHVPNEFSTLFKGLVHSLMHPLPEMRLSAQQVIDHPWLSADVARASSFSFKSGSSLTSSDRSHSLLTKLAAPLAMRFKQSAGKQIPVRTSVSEPLVHGGDDEVGTEPQ